MQLMLPFAIIGSCELAKVAVRSALEYIDDWLAQSPSKICLRFTNAFYGLFTRRIREINPKDLVYVPSDVPGC